MNLVGRVMPLPYVPPIYFNSKARSIKLSALSANNFSFVYASFIILSLVILSIRNYGFVPCIC